MKLVINVGGEFGPDFAVVELTPDLLATIRARWDRFKSAQAEDESLAYQEYWDNSATFYTGYIEDALGGVEASESFFWNEGLALVETVSLGPKKPAGVDGMRMVVDGNSIHWAGCLGDLRVNTYSIYAKNLPEGDQ